MTHLSLFSGIGGIDLAAHWAGFSTIALVERDEYCQKVLAKNFPSVPIYDDVTTFDGTRYRGRTDLISAGFPCQPHSLAGSRKASGDERDLWGEVVRILSETRPRWFLGENVPGLFSSESGAFFGRILNDLEQIGYRVGWTMYGASDVGAVHRRNRVFIVAYCEGWEDDQRERGNLEEEASRGQSIHATPCISSADATNPDSSESGEVTRNAGEVREIQEEERESEHGASVLRRNRAEAATNPDSQRRDNGSDLRGERSVQRESVGQHPQDNPIGSQRDNRTSPDDDACDTSCRRLPGEPRRGTGQEPSYRYAPIQGGDWRTWDTKPVIRLSDDGIPGNVARNRLKALGNAVCPQQCYPILQAIADLTNPPPQVDI